MDTVEPTDVAADGGAGKFKDESGRFKKGNPGPPGVRKVVVEPLPEGVSQELADMRWVYENPGNLDRTQGQRTCRKWLKDDVRGFMAEKARREAQLVELKGDVGPVVDEGVERVNELIREILREAKGDG